MEELLASGRQDGAEFVTGGTRPELDSGFYVAPTLLTGLFGCANPPTDYASGHGLFTDRQWDWLIATDYTDYAVVEPAQVTVVLAGGYEIRDENYRLVRHPTLPQESLRAALREMSRFYR